MPIAQPDSPSKPFSPYCSISTIYPGRQFYSNDKDNKEELLTQHIIKSSVETSPVTHRLYESTLLLKINFWEFFKAQSLKINELRIYFVCPKEDSPNVTRRWRIWWKIRAVTSFCWCCNAFCELSLGFLVTANWSLSCCCRYLLLFLIYICTFNLHPLKGFSFFFFLCINYLFYYHSSASSPSLSLQLNWMQLNCNTHTKLY